MASIRKRKNKWFVDFYVGTARKRMTFSNKAEAEAFKRDLVLTPVNLMTGYVRVIEATVRQASDDYLELVSSKKAPDTFVMERKYFNKLCNHFEGRLVSSLNYLDVQMFQTSLFKTVSAATVNRYFNTFRNFFRYCKRWNYCAINPTLDLPNLKVDEKRVIVRRDHEIQAVIDILRPWEKRVIYFIAHTGIRRGEACRAKPEDVDLEGRVIFIKSYKGGQARIREVPLTDEMTSFLEDQLRNHTREYLFVNEEGKQIMPIALSTQMNRAASKAGFKGMNLHSLRHSILSKLADSNVSLRKIQTLAGHSSMKTTEKYLQENREALRKDLETLGSTTNVIKLNDRFGRCWAPKENPQKAEGCK